MEWVWIETFERRQTLPQHGNLEAFKKKMAERDAGTFPAAGPFEARTLFIAPDGRYVIDAVLPPAMAGSQRRVRLAWGKKGGRS